MTLGVSLTIGFYFSWQISLVAIVFIPLCGGAWFVMYQQLSGAGAEKEQKAFEESQNLVSEGNIF